MVKIIVNNSVESMKEMLDVMEECMKLEQYIKEQQIKEQRKIIEIIELQEISKEVAVYLDEWLDEPIPKHLSEAQDSKLFAYRMTKFIKQKLRN